MDELAFETLGSCPVPGGTPAGEDARYEPEYAYVLEEIEKLSFSGDGAPVSWQSIEKNAVLILSEKSKDLQIAAYLAVALFQNKGLKGLCDGVRVLCGLMGAFWETAWPPLKRMRGRVNAVDWWHERAYSFLQSCTNEEIPEEQQKDLLKDISDLDELVSSLMPEASPLTDLLSAVRRLPVFKSDQEAEEEISVEADVSVVEPKSDQSVSKAKDCFEETRENNLVQEQLSPPAVNADNNSTEIPTERYTVAATQGADDPAVLRRNFVNAGMVYLPVARLADPTSPSVWQLSRLLIWGGISALPDSEDGQTLLPPPDGDILARFRFMLEEGKALEAALDAEDFFSTVPFCLDIQEIIHSALVGLGARFADAAYCVQEESFRFFSRLPGIENLLFNDGSPFVSSGTVNWLKAGRSKPVKFLEPPSESCNNVFETTFAAARELVEQSRLTEALAKLDAIKTDSPTLNLQIQVQQLRLLQASGENESARALAEALLEDLNVRSLDNWDPQLTATTLMAVYNAFILDPTGYEHELKEIRRRIARLRPAVLS